MLSRVYLPMKVSRGYLVYASMLIVIFAGFSYALVSAYPSEEYWRMIVLGGVVGFLLMDT